MILLTKNLRKEVSSDNGTLVILEDINLEIEQGQTIAITGPSGSGKSTLLGLLAGLDDLSQGEIYLNNNPLHELNEEERALVRKENVAFVFQSFELLPGLTALENVMLPSELNSKVDAKELAQSYLERVGLAERMTHYPNQLSGGEQQRVAIARAFACEAKVLFADEPTGNLDSQTGNDVIKLFKDLHDQGQTIILITHENEIASIAQRTIFIKDGLIESDTQNK